MAESDRYTRSFWKPVSVIQNVSNSSDEDTGCMHTNGPDTTYMKAVELAIENQEAYLKYFNTAFDFEVRSVWDVLRLFAPHTNYKFEEGWSAQDLSNMLNLIMTIGSTTEIRAAAHAAKDLRNANAHSTSEFSQEQIEGYLAHLHGLIQTTNTADPQELLRRIDLLKQKMSNCEVPSPSFEGVDEISACTNRSYTPGVPLRNATKASSDREFAGESVASHAHTDLVVTVMDMLEATGEVEDRVITDTDLLESFKAADEDKGGALDPTELTSPCDWSCNVPPF